MPSRWLDKTNSMIMFRPDPNIQNIINTERYYVKIFQDISTLFFKEK